MSETKRICDHDCAAFIVGHCALNLETSEFITINGAARVVELCKLPHGLKIINGRWVKQEDSACDMKEKIQALCEQVKRDFPNGCRGISCGDCPLDVAHPSDMEEDV